MKTTYSYEELLKFDDPFEYELGLPLKINNLPSTVVEEDIPDSKTKLLEKLAEGYSLIIQKPQIPNEKVFAALQLLGENDFMKLYAVNEKDFNEPLWDLLYESEYNLHWTFFLLIEMTGVVFELSYTGGETRALTLSGLNANTLIHLRLEVDESVTCRWG
ncbi:hypothetical protein Exig_1297 [Exiguobacterium sibiricum 255-15]|uniref:Uncharacterized protein n=1 Tax=Exiguobacterium sibiricum (strain DSM 17290 / CCUG 55495 / CIP 109462 / JCM 13490 / 255-15) TaxID=262543 RepID=B1YF94_EXIS2|nr:hypothetical protein [Exiguobacterium sibiricum]ACB60770.1 hypothetical protein Exig_1297 [Exiguobacterium sibiricum 255-15]